MGFSRRKGRRFNRGRGPHGAPAAGGGPPPDTTPPTFAQGEASTDGWEIFLPASEDLNDALPAPAAGDFALTNTPIEVILVTVSTAGVTLSLSAVVSSDETTIGVSYTPGGNPIEDLAGNAAEAFTDETIDPSTSSHLIYRPYGYGSVLKLDLLAGSDFYDLGIGGIARWYDQSAFGNDATQSDSARQPQVSGTGVDGA